MHYYSLLYNIDKLFILKFYVKKVVVYMTNKQYLDTIITCKNLDLSNERIKFLKESKINLIETVRYIKRLFNRNSSIFDEEEIVLRNISIVLWNYRDIRINIEDYIESYKRYIKAFIDLYLSNNKDIAKLSEIECIMIGPMNGIRHWKTKHWKINSLADKKVKIENEKGYLYFKSKDSGIFDQLGFYNKDKNDIWRGKNIKAIFISKDNVKYIESEDIFGELDILRRIVRDDNYDLVITSPKGYHIQDIIERYLMTFKDVSMAEYLDLVAFLEDWEYNNDNIEFSESEFYVDGLESYDRLRKSKVNPKDVLELLEPLYEKSFQLHVVSSRIELLSVILTRDDITDEGLEKLKHLINLMVYQLWIDVFDVDAIKVAKDFNEVLEIMRRCKASDIGSYTEQKKFIDYKRINTDKKFALLNLDGKLEEISSSKEGFGIIVELDIY